MDEEVSLAEIPVPGAGEAGAAPAESRANVVTGSPQWARAWSALGLAGGAVYLAVLPVGHVTALRSLGLIAALMAALALWAAPSRRVLPVLAAFAVWFAAATLSLLTTRNLGASLEAMNNEILRSLLVFLVFYVLTRRLAAYSVWVFATAFGFAVLSVLAIDAFFTHGRWHSHYVPALQNFATCAVTVLPLVAGYLIFRRGHWPTTALLTGTVALMLSAGYLTLSRGFWLVLMCGAFLAVALNAWRTGQLKRRSLALLAIVCMVGISAASLAALQRARSVVSLEDRVVIYTAAIAKIAQNPLTGSGYGHETDAARYAAAMPNLAVFHAHNIVLSFLDQMGVAGLVALAAIFGAPAVVLFRELRSPAGDAALCGLVLLGCVFVANNLDYFFVKQNLWLFFANLGIYHGRIDRVLADGSGVSRAMARSLK
jgi:O-antigen ligase